MRDRVPVVMDATLGSAANQLERDDQALERIARDGGCAVRLWRSLRCIVVPRRESVEPAFPAAAAACHERGWPLVVRRTGGTAYPIGPETIQLSLHCTLPAAEGVRALYRRLCDPVVEALRRRGVEATLGSTRGSLCDGSHNIRVQGKKLAGTAQRRRLLANGTSAALAHAAISVEKPSASSLAAVETYYRMMGRTERFDADRHTALDECLDGRIETRAAGATHWALHWLAGVYSDTQAAVAGVR